MTDHKRNHAPLNPPVVDEVGGGFRIEFVSTEGEVVHTRQCYVEADVQWYLKEMVNWLSMKPGETVRIVREA